MGRGFNHKLCYIITTAILYFSATEVANVSRGEDTSRHEMTVAVKFAEIEDKTLSPTEPAKESMEGNTFADRLI